MQSMGPLFSSAKNKKRRKKLQYVAVLALLTESELRSCVHIPNGFPPCISFQIFVNFIPLHIPNWFICPSVYFWYESFLICPKPQALLKLLETREKKT